MPQVMNSEDIRRVLRRISHEIVETHRGISDVVIVGIHTRGVHLAREIAFIIRSLENREVPVGELDIALYRDDRDLRGDFEPNVTDIPVAIENKKVVVVDDVLYTGRTARAALDALSDIGRALTTELAVLIDRGHRELPIRADYVGKNIPTSHDERVKVRLLSVDADEGIWVDRSEVA